MADDDSEFPEHKHEEARRDIGSQVQTKRKFGIGSGDALVTGTLQGVGDPPFFLLYKIVGRDNRTLLAYPGGCPKYRLVDEDPGPSSQPSVSSDPGPAGGRRRKTRRRRRSTYARTSKRLRRRTARASASSRARRARRL